MAVSTAEKTKATILVVDDDEDVRAVTTSALERCGFQVVEASSAREAVVALEAPQPIDLVLTDVVMPGGSGFHVQRAAEQRRPGIKVLLMSAFAEGLIDAQLPPERFLPKPFRVEELKRKVGRLLHG
jgi:CheY-like chemotaxis protein